MDELLTKIECITGFHTFETTANNQMTFYGTSDMLSEFKTLAADNFPTGTLFICIDNGLSQFYSRFKNAWF